MIDDRLPRLGGCAFMAAGGLMLAGSIPAGIADPAGLLLIPFGLVFVGAGWAVRRLFVAPPGKKHVLVSGQEIATATGTRAEGVAILVDAGASPAEVAAARQAWHDAEWLKRPDWVAGRIEEEGVRQAGNLACGGLIWTVIALGLGVYGLIAGDPIGGIAAAGCGLVALGLFTLELVERARRRKYGTSELLLSRTPVHLGERLQCVVQTGVRGEAPPADGFRWALECVHQWEERTGTGDARRTTHRRDVLWRSEGQAEGRDSPSAPGFLAFPLAVDLPADRPSTTLGGGSEGVSWRLSVRAALPGLDYVVEFRLPVLRPGEAG